MNIWININIEMHSIQSRFIPFIRPSADMNMRQESFCGHSNTASPSILINCFFCRHVSAINSACADANRIGIWPDACQEHLWIIVFTPFRCHVACGGFYKLEKCVKRSIVITLSLISVMHDTKRVECVMQKVTRNDNYLLYNV